MKQVIRLLVFFAVVANVYADCYPSPQEPHDLLSQSAEKPIGALKILAPAVLHKSQTSFIWGTGAGISCRQACAPLMGTPQYLACWALCAGVAL
jgi:hypothetical protein